MIEEDKKLILDTFGNDFECDMGKFKGLLGTDIITMSGGVYEIATKNISVQVETDVMYNYELNPGTSFTYKYSDRTYVLTITSPSDNLDGWTELFCDVRVENV